MALRTPPRPTRLAAPARRRDGGKLILVLLVVVALGVAYLTVTGQLPGLPHAQPTPTGPTLPAQSLSAYIDFWDEHGQAVPPELSIGAVTGMASECAYGGMPPNKPEYADADSIGRARGGWVCLEGTQTAVPDSQCPAPGTNLWRGAQRPRLPDLRFVVNGHIVAKALSGDGNAMRNGQCVNMVPQSATPNSQMAALERYVKGLVENPANAGVSVFYLVVPVYTGGNYMPDAMWVFILSTLGPEQARTYPNEPHHITDVGGAQ